MMGAEGEDDGDDEPDDRARSHVWQGREGSSGLGHAKRFGVEHLMARGGIEPGRLHERAIPEDTELDVGCALHAEPHRDLWIAALSGQRLVKALPIGAERFGHGAPGCTQARSRVAPRLTTPPGGSGTCLTA